MVALLKVTQIKSTISERPNQRESVRSLGLKRIGDVTVREDNLQNRGYVRTVAHLVRVEEIDSYTPAAVRVNPVTQPSTKVINDAGHDAPHGGEAMSEQLASALRQGDGDYVFDTGDFLEWHRQGTDRSLIWSTERSAGGLLKAAGPALGKINPQSRGVVVIGSERRILDGPEIAEVVLKNPDEVKFLRVEYIGGVALLWSRVSGNLKFDQASSFREASVIFDAETASSVESALLATATEHVGKLATSIVSHVAA